MVTGYAALTDKERETLRLILHGHDAKSMARELDLSVHTVNERLRNARRKLDVTSSKEAARLLFEEEADDPQFLGHKSLGDAADPAATDTSRTSGRGMSPRLVVTGVLAMIAILAAAALLTPGAAPDTGAIAMEAQEGEAQAAALEFLEMLDADDWDGTYAVTASSFREANSVELWTSVSEGVRGELGAFVSRQYLGEDDVPSPQGIRAVRFRAQYANRADVQETVSLVREDGTWKVAGIYVS